MTDVVISFAPKDHKKLEKAFKDIAKAQQAFIESTKKTRKALNDTQGSLSTLNDKIKLNKKEYRELSKAVKAAGMNMRTTGVSFETLKAAAQGNSQALAIVTRSFKQYNLAQTKASTGMFDLTNNGRLLNNSFATLRSQLLLVSFGMGLVTSAVLKNVNSYATQEESLARLAMEFGQNTHELVKYSQEMQKATRFGDEQVQSVLALMGSYGANAEEAKKLTQATMDLAEGMQTDLNSAARLVAKTFGTSTDALGRYVDRVEGAVGSQERLENIVKNVDSVFGQLAQRMGKLTSGSLADAQNAFGDLQERLGQALAPLVLIVARGMKFLAESIPVGLLKVFVNLITIGGTALLVFVNRAKLMAFAIGLKTAAWGAYTAAQYAAIVGLKGFFKVLKVETGGLYLLITLLGTIAVSLVDWLGGSRAVATEQEKINQLIDEFGGLTGAQRANIRKLAKGNEELAQSILNNIKNIRQQISLLKAKNIEDKQQRALKIAEAEAGRKLSDTEKELIITLHKKKLAYDDIQNSLGVVQKNTESLENLYAQTRAGQRATLRSLITWASQQKNLSFEAAKGLEILNEQYDNLTKSDHQITVAKLNEKLTLQNTILKESDPINKQLLAMGIKTKELDYDKTLALKELIKENEKLTKQEKEKLDNEKFIQDTVKKGVDAQKELLAAQRELIESNEDKFASDEDYQRALAANSEATKKFEADQKSQTRATIEQAAATKRAVSDFRAAQDSRNLDLFEFDITRPIQSIKQFATATKTVYDNQKDRIQEQRDLNQKLYDEDLISNEDYYAKKAELYDQDTQLLVNQLEIQQAVRQQAVDMAMQTFTMISAGYKQQVEQEAKDKLAALKKEDRYIHASNEQRKKMEDDVNKSMAKKRRKVFYMDQASKMTDIIINTASAYMGAVEAYPETTGSPFKEIIAALGAVQLGIVASQKPPKYATGGLVGGYRHSQGGTMIEAERGEFVMSRRAVDEIGADNLYAMNETGSAGAVTVNVTGNVMTQDFVEGELAESIKEAIRRGSDFGIN